MTQISINKASLVFLAGQLFFLCNSAMANNSSYITLSSQIARKRQLEIVANNTANINTVGFEQDKILLRPVNVVQNSKRSNSFVWPETTYRSGEQGPIKITNRPTDVAIAGNGYFKLMTPKGPRYTLDGSMFISNQGVLVNSTGYPFLSLDNAPIELPEQYQNLDITRQGLIFIDGDEIAQLGVFEVDPKDSIIKEGNNLYSTVGADRPMEEFTIISGALKGSNVNSTLAMAQMVESQRSYGLITDLMSNVNDVETSAINKLTK
jgi:flagellar basal-body rod protein FlgF